MLSFSGKPMRLSTFTIILALASPAASQEAYSTQPAMRVQTPAEKPKLSTTEIEGAKARAVGEAREKARDARMRRDMRGICTGC
jgi:hypothetical protein